MTHRITAGQKIKILLVEDVQADRMMINQAIAQSGFDAELKFAENIEDALTLAFIHHFDCILLDYYYPTSGNGLDFIKTYQSRNGQAPVVIVTAHNDTSLAVECMKMGASDYISKQNLSAEQIIKSLNYILRIKEAEQSRLAAERALMESELRMKNIIERSPVIVFTIDNAGYFKLFKGQGTSYISISPDDIMGRNIQDVSHLIPVRYDDYMQALQGKELTYRVEVNKHFFDVNYIPVYNPSRKISSMMGVAIDITDFKLNETQLINTIESTEADSKVKQQFLANMSHEIRTPIHGIISLTEFVMKTVLVDDQRKYLKLIKTSADNLLTIVNDILDLSKIQADKMTFEEIPFNLVTTIDSSIGTFIPKAHEKSIQLEVKIESNVPLTVHGDPIRLLQIINNLVGNAVKFTNKGSVSLSIKCTEENEEYSMLCFEVKDTGVGIPSHVLPSIFDSFSQAGNDISRKYGGTGLGLTIAKNLIEQQNGNITVQSKVNEGTMFIFSIPYKIKGDEKNNNVRESKMVEEFTKKLNILIAEDNDINRFIIKKMMEDWGYDHEFALNGIEVVEKASNAKYDLILMDVEMPEMNGYEATEVIRKQLPTGKNNIPIVAMTGHAMHGEKEKCIDAGMNDYISKPFQSIDLQKKIIECIGQTIIMEVAVKQPHNTTQSRCTNMEFLIEISDGNESFYKEFITLFLNSAPTSISDMEKALQEKDWEAMRQAAHKIKPSFNYVGLKDLNKAASRIEDLSKRKANLEEIPALINAIKTTCEIAYCELREEVKVTA